MIADAEGSETARDKALVPEYLPQPHLDVLSRSLEVAYDPDLHADRPRLLAEASDAVAVLIRNRTLIDPQFLDAAPELRVVGRLGVGLDNIDMEAAAKAGVLVIPAYGGNAVSVAEYVMGAMLHLQRRVFAMTPSMVSGAWPRQGHAFGRELMGKTLGLVGFGAIAREVAKRALAFGMVIVAHDPLLDPADTGWDLARSVSLPDLLATSDVVSLHVPLTAETAGLFSADLLSQLKTGAILINTARGGIVDESALAGALRSGALGGAAVDVFATEPLGEANGEIFSGIENLVLTPHIAGNTVESVDRVATMTVEAVLESLGRSVEK